MRGDSGIYIPGIDGNTCTTVWEEDPDLAQLCQCAASQDPRNTAGYCLACGKVEQGRWHLDPAPCWDLRAMIEEALWAASVLVHVEEIADIVRLYGAFFQSFQLEMLLLADMRDLRAEADQTSEGEPWC